MRRILFLCLSGLASCLLISTVVLAGSRNPADFPLRVHIFSHNGVSHYYDTSLALVDGEGRANLYENGEPRAFDYSYRCESRLMNSIGYETYMARWKKQGKTLELLQPVTGKTCELKIDLKEALAYHKHKGSVLEEPAAKFKEWMVRHQYDPEHGMNQPVSAAPTAGETDTQ
jgi:hypothetical protein